MKEKQVLSLSLFLSLSLSLYGPRSKLAEFDDFEMPLASEDDNPWGLAVPLAEKDCIFGHFMSGITYNMHQSGRLIELEQKHGIQSTNYLVIQKYRNKDWLEGK